MALQYPVLLNSEFFYVLEFEILNSIVSLLCEGHYYLVDAGYCNAKGFLAPYRGQRYHLNEFDGHRPQTAQEFYNMKHSKARNCIEKCFGLLKGRWKILASPSFFSIQTQVRIIMACCLLHNLIRQNMSVDPQEATNVQEGQIEDEQTNEDDENNEEDGETMDEGDYITHIAPSDAWVAFRNNLSNEMFTDWNNRANR